MTFKERICAFCGNRMKHKHKRVGKMQCLTVIAARTYSNRPSLKGWSAKFTYAYFEPTVINQHYTHKLRAD